MEIAQGHTVKKEDIEDTLFNFVNNHETLCDYHFMMSILDAIFKNSIAIPFVSIHTSLLQPCYNWFLLPCSIHIYIFFNNLLYLCL